MAPRTVRFVFIGRYSMAFGENPLESALTEYEREYPTNRLGCAFMQYRLTGIELRELEPAEIRKYQNILNEKLAEITRKGLKPFAVPYERFHPKEEEKR
jgi:hypothetical protein